MDTDTRPQFTPRSMGPSVNGAPRSGRTVAMNIRVAIPLELPASLAVTVTIAVPSPYRRHRHPATRGPCRRHPGTTDDTV